MSEIITLIGCIILSIWPASFGVKMVGYFLLWMNNSGGPILIVCLIIVSSYPPSRTNALSCSYAAR